MIYIFAVQIEENLDTDVLDRISLVDDNRENLASGMTNKKKNIKHRDGGLLY